MSIVGYSSDANSKPLFPLYWSSHNAPPQRINITGIASGRAAAYGINASGAIVGAIVDSDGTNLAALYWSSFNAPPQLLNITGLFPDDTTAAPVAKGINDSGAIVGLYNLNGGLYWSSFNALPQFINTTDFSLGLNQAYGINASGAIVGVFIEATTNNEYPVYWSSFDTPFQRINTSGITYTALFTQGINASGAIVGYCYNNVQDEFQPLYWSSYNAPPQFINTTNLLAIGFNKACGINASGAIVGLGVNTDGFKPMYWSSFNAPPQPLSTVGFANDTLITASGINDSKILSNICFPAGTPIQTDQGIIPIEQLENHKHTINKQAIKHITQTTTLDKYLICFKQHALKYNCPSKTTVMSKDHQIEFEGRLVPAYRFLDYSDKVKKVKYNGEVLYNVLLTKPSVMHVNNLICETLHPENVVAKLYTNSYTDTERSAIIVQLNDSLGRRDLEKYKTLLGKHFYKRSN